MRQVGDTNLTYRVDVREDPQCIDYSFMLKNRVFPVAM